MTGPITVGEQFGRLVVFDPNAGRRGRHRLVRLRCAPELGGCGGDHEATVVNLRNGSTQSCGCRRFDPQTVHGQCGHYLYGTWLGMLARCESPASDSYRWYGGRTPPVTVYGPWHDVARFITDIEAEIGPRPEGFTPAGRPLFTLNRKDPDGNYEPGNIEWADWPAQARARRRPAARYPERDRQVLQMRATGQTYPQIGAALGITESAARKIVVRASR